MPNQRGVIMECEHEAVPKKIESKGVTINADTPKVIQKKSRQKRLSKTRQSKAISRKSRQRGLIVRR